MQLFIKILALWLLYGIAEVVAQPGLKASLQYSYLIHARLHGFAFSHDVLLGDGQGQLLLGLDAALAQGNRNVDMSDTTKRYSFEYDSYYPAYQGVVSPTFLWDHQVELQVKTSTAYQFMPKVGYSRAVKINGKIITVYGGGFFTYVNKSYIAHVYNDAQFDWYYVDTIRGSYDLTIPFYLRYWDIGIFAGATYPLLTGKRTSLCAEVSYFQPFASLGSLSTGLALRIRKEDE